MESDGDPTRVISVVESDGAPTGVKPVVESDGAPTGVKPVDRAPPHADESISPSQETPRPRPEDDARSDIDDGIAPDENGDPVDLGTLSGYTGSPSSHVLSGSTMAVPGMRSFRVDRGRESLTKPPVELEAPVNWPIQEHATKASKTSETPDESARDEMAPLGVDGTPPVQNAKKTELHGESGVQEDGGTHPHQPRLYTGWTSEGDWKRHLKSLQEIPPSTLVVDCGHPSTARAKADVEGPRHTPSALAFQPARSHEVIPDSTPPQREIADRKLRVPSNAAAHPLGVEYGAVSLTPLREIIDTGRDVSDDSASLSPSYHTPNLDRNPSPKPPDDHPPNGEISNSMSSAPSQSAPSFQSVHKRKTPPSIDTSGPERASVQRISPSPKEQNLPNRTSTSSNREVRPHTAASGASQLSQKVKGLIGRESTDAGAQLPARRSSSAGNENIMDEKGNTGTSVTLRKQQSFEKLIKSDETIQYTLTPRNVRDLEVRHLRQTTLIC